MGLFEQFPYTNFQELNLGWILEIVKKSGEEWEATKSEWKNYKEFIDNYFSRLDVQEEINNKINSMVSDGSFLNTIEPTVVSTTTSTTTNWLKENTVPGQTAILDKTFTIENAAAESKAVGDSVFFQKSKYTPVFNTSSISNISQIEGNSVAVIVKNSGIAGLPEGTETHDVYIIKYTTTRISDGTAGGVWLCIDLSTNYGYIKYVTSSVETNWEVAFAKGSFLYAKPTLSVGTISDDISAGYYYSINRNDGSPDIIKNIVAKQVVNVGSSSGKSCVQHVVSVPNTNTRNIYLLRSFSDNGTKTIWSRIPLKDVSSKKMVAFGDSTTKGETKGGSVVGNPWPSTVAHNFGRLIDNRGVGGQGLIKDWSAINATIDEFDFTPYDICLVCWAYNNPKEIMSTLNFGNENSENVDTFVGYYFQIMKKIIEKNKNMKVILITGYGSTQSPIGQVTAGNPMIDGFLTFKDGKKTYKEIYDTLKKMCNYHGFMCINQAEGGWVNEFTWTNYISDQIHPTATGYEIYGDYLTARLSQYIYK